MALDVDNLSVWLADENPVIRDISFSASPSQCVSITGGASSGKTALGITLCGFLPLWCGEWIAEGQITRGGIPVVQGESHTAVGIVLENPYAQVSGMKKSVRQELAFPLECMGIPTLHMPGKIDEYSELLGITGLLDRDIRVLSGGELQRVLIAAALIAEPNFLFLDRPMTEIDSLFRRHIMSVISTRTKEMSVVTALTEDSWLIPDDMSFDVTVDLGGSLSADIPFQTMHLPPSGERVLDVRSLSYSYEPDNTIFSDVSFSLGEGEVLFIDGANGSGKSTLARCIAGIYTPRSGSVGIFPGSSETDDKKYNLIGFSFQNPDFQICRKTVGEELKLASDRYGLVEGVVELLGIGPLYNRHPLELTRAEKKRLGVALASGREHRIVILDEPSQYQDARGFIKIVNAVGRLCEEGAGVIIISHDPRFSDVLPNARRYLMGK